MTKKACKLPTRQRVKQNFVFGNQDDALAGIYIIAHKNEIMSFPSFLQTYQELSASLWPSETFTLDCGIPNPKLTPVMLNSN